MVVDYLRRWDHVPGVRPTGGSQTSESPSGLAGPGRQPTPSANILPVFAWFPLDTETPRPLPGFPCRVNELHPSDSRWLS